MAEPQFGCLLYQCVKELQEVCRTPVRCLNDMYKNVLDRACTREYLGCLLFHCVKELQEVSGMPVLRGLE
jgi:hypothetical protein